MDNRLVRRVPEIKSDICPFCRNKLDQRIARCSNNLYNDGNIFEHELFYCGACDLWYAVKGKTMPFVLHNAFCFPLLKGKKYTLEMLRWRIFGKDPYAAVEGSKRFSPAVTWIDTSQNNVSKQKASTTSKSKSVSVNQNQPAQKHNEAEYRYRLREQLIEKYEAPQSMVTMLSCTVEEIIGSAMSPPDEPAIIFLVSAIKDDQKRPNYYYIHGKVGQMIIRSLASHTMRFRINRGKQDFRYLVNYYYVGPMMDAFLKEERSKIDDRSDFEGIVDVKLYKGRNVCRSHGDIVQRVVAMLPGTRSDERHPLAVYYCPACRLYYVNEDAYLNFCDNFGLPPLKLVASANDDFSGEGLRQISDLRAYGYDVSKSNQQDPMRRKRILVDLIESGLLTKAKILSHLEFLNRLNRSKPEQINACRARQEDYDYISSYKINEDRVIWGRIVPTK